MRCSSVAFTVALALVVPVAALAGAEREKKVLIIGIDGVRSDALLAADTPSFDALIADGAFSDVAITGRSSSSGPGWSSMLTGVWATKHLVFNNEFLPEDFDSFPHFFTRLKEVDPSLFTASIVHWSPINERILSDADLALTGLADAAVAAEAAALLTNGDPDVVFLHFDDVDHAGHGYGFHPAVPEYLDAIEITDGYVRTVLDALVARPNYADEDWLILSSTDHGGGPEGSHGQPIPEHRTMYVLASGTPAAKGIITPGPRIIDVPVTAMAHLGVVADPAWAMDGSVVGLANPPPRPAITDALVAHLPFDGDTLDVSGRGNHGTPVGAPVFAGGGLQQVGSHALGLSGERGEHVTLGRPADLVIGPFADFSAALWVRAVSGAEGSTIAASRNTTDLEAAGWSFEVSGSGRWVHRVADGSETQLNAPTTRIDDGWHHLVASYDRSSHVNLYVDGVQFAGSRIDDLGSLGGALATVIGQDGARTDPDGAFVGLIDDVGIWRRALTDADVSAIHAAGLVGLSLAEAAAQRVVPATRCVAGVDTDGDGLCDADDSCPLVKNPAQQDSDGDGIGEVCDPCTDADGDGAGRPGSVTCPRPELDCNDANPFLTCVGGGCTASRTASLGDSGLPTAIAIFGGLVLARVRRTRRGIELGVRRIRRIRPTHPGRRRP